jgi:hypothetical protein
MVVGFRIVTVKTADAFEPIDCVRQSHVAL